MTSTDTRTIEAAGGVVWRPNTAGDDIEIALIHRPKYDDWSLPKGKLKNGEHPIVGATREVEEETGLQCVVGRSLGEIHYDKEGVPKRVRYWALRYDSGTFEPNDEVDVLEWLSPSKARKRLLPERDRGVLDELMHGPVATFPVLVVRHGSAGERGSFDGPDRKRPLDAKGEKQAVGLDVLLGLFGVEDLHSADVVRCTSTLAPFADSHGLKIATDAVFSERGWADDPDGATDRLVELAARALPTAVCSQGRTIPGLLADVCDVLGVEPPDDLAVRKGALWVLHFDDEVDELELVDLERIDPLV